MPAHWCMPPTDGNGSGINQGTRNRRWSNTDCGWRPPVLEFVTLTREEEGTATSERFSCAEVCERFSFVLQMIHSVPRLFTWIVKIRGLSFLEALSGRSARSCSSTGLVPLWSLLENSSVL
jgi:hypothetical protein